MTPEPKSELLTEAEIAEIESRDTRVTIYDAGTVHERVGGDHGPQSAIDRRALLRHLRALKSAAHTESEGADNYHDAYRGARDDLLEWKQRALKAEANSDQLAHALAEHVNGQTFMGEPARPRVEPSATEHFPATSEPARCCYRYDDESRCTQTRDTHSFCLSHAKQIRRLSPVEAEKPATEVKS